jgi:hypothetical protein
MIKEFREENYITMHIKILTDDKLSHSSRGLYMFIVWASHRFHMPEGISEMDLRNMVKCSVPSLRTWLKILEDAGHIKKDYEKSPPGKTGRKLRLWKVA